MYKEADGQSDLDHDQSDCQVGARPAGRDQQAGERRARPWGRGQAGDTLGNPAWAPRAGEALPMLWTDTSSGRKRAAPDPAPFFLPQDEERELQHGPVRPGVRDHGQRRDDGRDGAGAAASLHPLRGPGTVGLGWAGPGWAGRALAGRRGARLRVDGGADAGDTPSRLEPPPEGWTDRDPVWVS